MSFQSPQNRPKDPTLSHYSLVKDGPQKVIIHSAPKWVKNNTLCVIEVSVDGAKHVYYTNKPDVAEAFAAHIGKEVVLMASGNSKKGTDAMQIHLVKSLPAINPPSTQSPPLQAIKELPSITGKAGIKTDAQTPPIPMKGPIGTETEVKKYLCQASNLMRLCVKKANDIAIELNLPPEHRQGIATTLFIQSDRMGHVSKMPLQPFTPQELGYGASKACSLASPQPESE